MEEAAATGGNGTSLEILPRVNSGNTAKSEPQPQAWEARMRGETAQAFRAFFLFRNMGFRRTIKGCMEMNEIPSSKYTSWCRWAKLFDWQERAALYDEHIAKETERQIIAEHVERKRRIMSMLNKVDSLVDRRLDTLDANSLDAGGTMDLLERSAKLGGYVSGTEKASEAKEVRQLEINFVDSFDGV